MPNKPRDIGIGHNQIEDTAIENVERVMKQLFSFITFHTLSDLNAARSFNETARHGKTLADRIDAVRDTRNAVNDAIEPLDLINRFNYSTHWGKMALVQEAKHPEHGDRFAHVRNIKNTRTQTGEYEDEPCEDYEKSQLRSCFWDSEKDIAEYLIKENEKAWEWYDEQK